MHKFERNLDPARCRRLDSKADRDAEFTKAFDNRLGLYFDGKGPAEVVRLSNAPRRMSPYPATLVSIMPGVQAVFVHHDGGVWVCARP